MFAGLGAIVATALALAAPSSASAAFGVNKWEAGTCKISAPECTYSSSKTDFFTQVAGRPGFGITDFAFNIDSLGVPEGAVRDARVDLPPGLSVNPQATGQCTAAQLESLGGEVTCAAAGAQVGTVKVTAVRLLGLIPISLSGIPVFNIVPRQGVPAEFGFHVGVPLVANFSIFLQGTVAWNSDYHEGFTIQGIPADVPLASNRLTFQGQAGNGSFITVGSNCNGSTTSGLTVDSHQAPGAFLHYDTTPIAPKEIIQPTGCGSVPFNPGIAVDPGTARTDSPTGAAVDATVPFEPSKDIGQANVKRAEVTLPKGMGLNPAAAPNLKACTDAQFGKGMAIGDQTRIIDPAGLHPPAIACPAGSAIGTVSIQTPVLPPNSLPGTVYLGEQLSRDPTSGKLYRIFVNAQSARYGVYVRLIGEISANPVTGQLTAIFDEPAQGGLPQVPFSSFRLQFDGAKGTLTSPPTCGPNTTVSRMFPWTGNAAATPSGSFMLTNGPRGGACAKTMAERPFAPGFAAAPGDRGVKTFTNFTAHFSRPDGQQELKGVDIVLPEGATAKLAGVPYCPPSEIKDAATRAGTAERKNPSCPDNSQVGVASIQAGTGPKPLKIDGKAYLAGPYQRARISLVVVTPAVAGPFDLGTVVVRVPLFLTEETAQIHPVTNAIPDVFGGAKLSIGSIFVNVNRKDFALTGTNCRKQETAGTILGGGADPTNPAAFSAFKVSDPYRGVGCKRLKFKPKLKLRLFGATQRAKHPRLRAALRTRPKDANIARASVALPHALFLDQASLATICTRVQFNADECPKRSIYGKARAFTPLLADPLEGPVYLRSSSDTLPNMVAHLEGQVDIDLVGRIDSFRGGIRTTFRRTPDVPVTKFVVTLPGGKHGLLVASRNLCESPVRAIIKLKGQNGKKANRRPKLRTPCGNKAGKGAGRKGARGAQ
ncbi:MAG: hypothetical protein WBL45_12980 [Solirubrobacterales bacterium]